MKAHEATKLLKEVVELQATKKMDYDFYMWLISIKKKVEPAVKDFDEKRNVIQECITDLSVEYCLKDKDGKPIVTRTPNGDIYDGLNRGINLDYDKKIKDLIEKGKALFNEDLSIDFSGIKKIKRSVIEKKNKDGEMIVAWDGNKEELLSEFIE